MTRTIERRIENLETREGVGYRPFRVRYFHESDEDLEAKKAAEAAEAEANGEQFYAVISVSPGEQSKR